MDTDILVVKYFYLATISELFYFKQIKSVWVLAFNVKTQREYSYLRLGSVEL